MNNSVPRGTKPCIKCWNVYIPSSWTATGTCIHCRPNQTDSWRKTNHAIWIKRPREYGYIGSEEENHAQLIPVGSKVCPECKEMYVPEGHSSCIYCLATLNKSGRTWHASAHKYALENNPLYGYIKDLGRTPKEIDMSEEKKLDNVYKVVVYDMRARAYLLQDDNVIAKSQVSAERAVIAKLGTKWNDNCDIKATIVLQYLPDVE